MQEVINEKINVITLYNKSNSLNMPIKLRWRSRVYSITKLGYHHKYKQGKTLIHVFSVSNNDLAFRLEFNTETLIWTLREISDGLTS